VLALPDDGKRYELVDGELLVSPSPRRLHQIALAGLFRPVDAYVRIHRLGTTLFSPADLSFREGQLVQPDLFVEARMNESQSQEWDESGVPILVAEILSPSTARFDRITKRRLYQRAGVGTYWIVDLDARLIEAWTPATDHPAIVDGELCWQPDPALAPLLLQVPEYFREVFGEGAGG
jgi:Uma2 family endonuclease